MTEQTRRVRTAARSAGAAGSRVLRLGSGPMESRRKLEVELAFYGTVALFAISFAATSKDAVWIAIDVLISIVALLKVREKWIQL